MKIIPLLFILSFPAFQLQAQKTYFCPPCDRNCDFKVYDKPGACDHCSMDLFQRKKEEQLAAIKQQNEERLRILFYLHDGVEILDWAGPAEAFTTAGFEVIPVTVDGQPITSQGVFQITPRYSIDESPKADMIAFFGGNSGAGSNNPKVLQWLKERAPKTDIIFSVCTGAFFLAKAGLLDHKVATTFHEAIDGLRKTAPKAEVIDGVKYVDNGKIVTAAGVSSGIHGALHLIKRLMGEDKASMVAEYMEYEKWDDSLGIVIKEE